MKEIYLREVYLTPNMSFDFNYQFTKFISSAINDKFYIEKIPFRKGFKTDTTDYTLVLNISCHADDFLLTGPTVYRKDQEIDFYLNIPYKKIESVKEQAMYLLDFIGLALIDLLQVQDNPLDIKSKISEIKKLIDEIPNLD